jgi:predicted amidohydrolase
MTARRSICVAQTCPIKGDIDRNVEQHLQLADLAASEGAQVIVFPELSLTGYEIELAEQLAFAENDARVARLVDAAASRSIAMIAGGPVRLDGRLHLGAFVLYPDRTTALYTKHRLGAFGASARVDGDVPPAETTVFHPGDRNPLVRLGDTNAAIAICADIGAPAHAQRAADRGAAAYLASMFVIPSDFDGDSARLARYAAQHAMVVAFANYGCPTGGLASAGRSAVWSQRGELIVQLPSSGAGVAVATEAPDGWRSTTVMLDDAR